MRRPGGPADLARVAQDLIYRYHPLRRLRRENERGAQTMVDAPVRAVPSAKATRPGPLALCAIGFCAGCGRTLISVTQPTIKRGTYCTRACRAEHEGRL